MYKYIIFLHVLAATIWVGGHIILVALVLPDTFKKHNLDLLVNFEKKYERIGMPSLLTLLLTGLYLAYNLLPDFSQWMTFNTHLTKHVSIKILLLLTTVLLALNARFRLFPNLSMKKLPVLATHIILVTIISILFTVTGLSFRLYFF